MRGGLVDAIVWLAVGASLLAQGLVIVALGWFPREVAQAADERTSALAGYIVGAAFVVTGLGALGLGYRRVRAASGRRQRD